MNKKNHLDYLSFARVFAIYWVVLIQHNFAPFHPDWGWVDCSGYPSYFDQLSPFTQLITLLSMPLCFFISGFVTHYSGQLTKRSEWKQYIWKKCQRLLFPCWVFGVLCELAMYGKVSFDALFGIHHLWFVFYLFIISIVAWWTMSSTKMTYLLFSVFIAVGCMVISKYTPASKLWGIGYYYLWFQFGFLVSAFKDRISGYLRYIPVFYTGILAIYLLFTNYNLPLSGGGRMVYEIAGVAMIIQLFRLLNRRYSPKDNKIWKLMDGTSYGLYIFHFIILFGFYSFFSSQNHTDWLIENAYWMTTILAFCTIPTSIVATIIFKNIKL
ncbi:acyltransferase family protein [Segatella copri]|uniref:acyltransferase family protein n=2 Tax=Segatella copri TaxID=165179 RepID=UPI001C38BEED|nr:acyltransferase family protein [Segatella copri]MBV4178459.1 acyltransferase [Segatella copri]